MSVQGDVSRLDGAVDDGLLTRARLTHPAIEIQIAKQVKGQGGAGVHKEPALDVMLAYRLGV